MSKLKSTVIATLVVWAVVTLSYAYLYVTSRTGLAGAEGYEAEWDWQLFFFAITRLPLLLIVLGIVLWLERRLLRQPS
jgi:hypothetical protein